MIKKLFMLIIFYALFPWHSCSAMPHSENNADNKHTKESLDRISKTQKEKTKLELETLVNLFHEKSESLTDADIEKLRTKVGDDVMLKVMQLTIHRHEMLAYIHRESLLPAINDGFFIEDVNNNAMNHQPREPFPRLLEKCRETYILFRQQPGNLPAGTARVLLSACANGSDTRSNNLANLQNLSFENLFGRSLRAGQYCVVGWSDGKTQIMISDSDKRTLQSLSVEQMLFINDLYRRPRRYWYDSDSHKLSYKEFKIFSSLPKGMQKTLKSNYPTLRFSWQSHPATYLAIGFATIGLIAIGKENRQICFNSVHNSVSWTWDWAKYIVTTPIKFGLTYSAGAFLNLLSRAAARTASWVTWDIG